MVDEDKILKDLKKRHEKCSRLYNMQKNSHILSENTSITRINETDRDNAKEKMIHITQNIRLSKRFTTYAFACHYIQLENH
jgi:hypothetical protein